MLTETETAWLRRAVHHCEFWRGDTPTEASANAWIARARGQREQIGSLMPIYEPDDDPEIWCVWLPRCLRELDVDEMRAMLGREPDPDKPIPKLDHARILGFVLDLAGELATGQFTMRGARKGSEG